MFFCSSCCILLQAPLLLCVIVLHHCGAVSLQLHLWVPRIHAISFIKWLYGDLLIGWLQATQHYMPQRHAQWKLTMFSLTPPLIYTHVGAQSCLTNTFRTFTHTCRCSGKSKWASVWQFRYPKLPFYMYRHAEPWCERISISLPRIFISL